MITELTPKQKELKKIIRDKWIGMLTIPHEKIDKDNIRKAVELVYSLAKLEKPKVIFLRSPLAIQFAANLFKNKYVMQEVSKEVWKGVEEEVWKEVEEEVRNEVGNEVWNEVKNEVVNEVWNEVRDEVWKEVWNEVREEVKNEVRKEVWNEVREEVKNEVRNEVGNEVVNEVGNEVEKEVGNEVLDKKLNFYQFGCFLTTYYYDWFSYYEYFIEAKIIKNNKSFETLKKGVIGVYETIQLDKVCLVSLTPTSVKKDDRGRLHSELEPAVKFADGYSVYALNGVRMPKDLWEKITKKTISVKEALSLTNAEHRNLAMSYVKDKLVSELPHKVISEDEYGQILELEEKDINGDKIRLFTDIDPSKNENVYELCPPDINTPKDFNTWAYSLGRFEIIYEPEVRH